jgi:hypothetical protein
MKDATEDNSENTTDKAEIPAELEVDAVTCAQFRD